MRSLLAAMMQPCCSSGGDAGRALRCDSTWVPPPFPLPSPPAGPAPSVASSRGPACLLRPWGAGAGVLVLVPAYQKRALARRRLEDSLPPWAATPRQLHAGGGPFRLPQPLIRISARRGLFFMHQTAVGPFSPLSRFASDGGKRENQTNRPPRPSARGLHLGRRPGYRVSCSRRLPILWARAPWASPCSAQFAFAAAGQPADWGPGQGGRQTDTLCFYEARRPLRPCTNCPGLPAIRAPVAPQPQRSPELRRVVRRTARPTASLIATAPYPRTYVDREHDGAPGRWGGIAAS